MRVLLVDDHHLFLEGLRNLLTAQGIEVVGLAHDGFEALQQARRLQPDLILMDIRMPRCNGLEATRLIKAEMPECKIVMLTMSDDEADVFEAIRSGASGYLLKSLKADHLYQHLTDLEAGRPAFSECITTRIVQEFKRTAEDRPARSCRDAAERDEREQLSPDQVQILMLIADGRTYRHIAACMGITERTVKYHMGEILKRLHLENRAQAIAYAAKIPRSQ